MKVSYMTLDKFTIKSQEAVQQAQQIANEHNHQQIENEHLLLGLIDQADGTVPSIIKKIGGIRNFPGITLFKKCF